MADKTKAPAAPTAPIPDAGALAARAAELDAKDGEGTGAAPAPGDEAPPVVNVEPPVIVTPTSMRRTLEILAKRKPSWELASEEIDALSDAWAPAINYGYNKLMAWLEIPVEVVGPLPQALAITAMVALPRILGALGLNAAAQDEPIPAPDGGKG